MTYAIKKYKNFIKIQIFFFPIFFVIFINAIQKYSNIYNYFDSKLFLISAILYFITSLLALNLSIKFYKNKSIIFSIYYFILFIIFFLFFFININNLHFKYTYFSEKHNIYYSFYIFLCFFAGFSIFIFNKKTRQNYLASIKILCPDWYLMLYFIHVLMSFISIYIISFTAFLNYQFYFSFDKYFELFPCIGFFIFILRNNTFRRLDNQITYKNIKKYILKIIIIFLISIIAFNTIFYKISSFLFPYKLNLEGFKLAKENKHRQAVLCLKKACMINPDYSTAHYNLASSLMALNNNKEALLHFNEALNINPDYAGCHNNIGQIYEQEGEIDKAVKHYSEAIYIFPNFFTARYNLAHALFKQKKLNESLKEYSNLIKIDPNNINALNYYNIVLKHIKLDQFIEKLKKEINDKPLDKYLYEKLAAFYIQKDEFENAINAFKKSLLIKPANYIVHEKIGNTYFKIKNFKSCFNHLSKALELNPKYEKAKKSMKYAKKYYKAHLDAIKFEKELKNNPDDITLNLRLSSALYSTKKYLNALTYLNKALEKDPRIYFALYYKGKILLSIKNYNKAIIAFTDAVKYHPQKTKLHKYIGDTFFKLNEHSKAIAHYIKYVKENNGDSNFYNSLATAYFKIKDIDNSIKYYNKALELKPDDALIHNNIGIVYFHKGDIEKSIMHYKTGLKYAPYNPEIHNNLGSALFQQSNIDDALLHLKTALNLKPDYKEAKENFLTLKKYQKKSIENQIIEIKENIKNDPENFQNYNNLGKLYLKNEDINKAVEAFEKCLSLNSDFFDALLNLAKSYTQQKDYFKAIEQYNKMLQIKKESAGSIYYNIACLYSLQNDVQNSLLFLNKSISKGLNIEYIKNDEDLKNIRHTDQYNALVSGK